MARDLSCSAVDQIKVVRVAVYINCTFEQRAPLLYFPDITEAQLKQKPTQSPGSKTSGLSSLRILCEIPSADMSAVSTVPTALFYHSIIYVANTHSNQFVLRLLFVLLSQYGVVCGCFVQLCLYLPVQQSGCTVNSVCPSS